MEKRPQDFQKGDPRINRKGRPKKKKSLTDILDRYGRRTKEDAEDGKRKNRKTLLAKKVWELALEGDVTCIKYIYDRIDGRPQESVEIKGDEEKPVGIVFLPQRKTPREWVEEHGGELAEADSAGMGAPTETGDSA